MSECNDYSQGNEPPLGNFAEARSIKRDLLAELRAGWEAGSPPRPEDLLKRWPANPAQDADTASLLFEDYLQRRQQDADDDEKRASRPSQGLANSYDGSRAESLFQDYERRFPGQKDSMARLLQQHALLQSMSAGRASKPTGGKNQQLALPGVGDEIFDFPLRHELGRGAFARVFLAEQTGLADRPIVLKVSAIEGDEHQTLAQLQHTNIVPIYSVHEDARAGLRAVCMPYFGGASLSAVLRALWTESSCPQSGAQLVDALAKVQSPTPAGLRSGSVQNPVAPASAPVPDRPEACSTAENPQTGDEKALQTLRGMSYIHAAVWLVSRLAEALQHAHERGVLHRDIKPSNVLLAADGQPMLLDFNLAQSTHDSQAAATLGGTVAYMAPEHLRALAGRDPALARQVDQRADIYSLGMVLYEMLAGKSPFDQSASYSPLPALIEAMAVERSRTVPSLRKVRADVPWSLESIARQCLAPRAESRYQQAEHVAEDLRRFLEDRPLRYAPELSWRERGRKWMRRHPRLTTSSGIGSLAALVLLTGASILSGTRAQLHATQTRAFEAEGAEALQRKTAFETDHQRALCLVNTTTDVRGQMLQGQAVCERALGRYEVLDRDDWQEHRDWKRLSAEDRERLAEDVREVLLLLARAKAHLEPENAVAEALRLVDRAEGIRGLRPSAALWDDRAYYLKQMGDEAGSAAASAKAQTIPARGARDHYWRATRCAYQGQYAEAVNELDEALRLNPQHYWSWLQRGICRLEMGEPVLAVGDFNACVALWPDFAWSYFNRGHVLDQLGKKREALADYCAAIERDADFVSAYVNRALVYLDTQRPAEALADLDHAVSLGQDDVRLHASRGLALEALNRASEADEAFKLAWKRDPHNLHMLAAYGFAVCRRLPVEARAAFTKVLEAEPRNTRARYGLGMLAAARDRQSPEALALFTMAIDIDPGFVDARRGRANVLAHRGEWDWARQDIDWCVKTEPTGVTLYAGACVYALMAEKCTNRVLAQWAAERALALLAAALERGYGREQAETDTDLAGIQNHPEFRRLLLQRQESRAHKPDAPAKDFR